MWCVTSYLTIAIFCMGMVDGGTCHKLRRVAKEHENLWENWTDIAWNYLKSFWNKKRVCAIFSQIWNESSYISSTTHWLCHEKTFKWWTFLKKPLEGWKYPNSQNILSSSRHSTYLDKLHYLEAFYRYLF